MAQTAKNEAQPTPKATSFTAPETNPANERAKRRWDTRTMVIIAVFVAIGAILSFIEIPLIPAAPWLKYDPSGAVSLISGFIFGPITGVVVAVLSWVPRLITNPIGAVMNIFAAAAIIIPASLIYRRSHTMSGAVKGMLVGIICSIIVSILLNFIATPLFMGGNAEMVAKLIIPVLIPFNLIKLLLNCAITILLYKFISNLVHGNTQDKEENLARRRRDARAIAEAGWDPRSTQGVSKNPAPTTTPDDPTTRNEDL